MAYEALRAAGFRTGLYTSPHLVDLRERMIVDDRPITPDAFVVWTERLRPHVERLDASFFEATTAIALADFAARGVDLAVVEVGLGGRLDCTNVIEPLASAVTTVSLEHAEYLGSDLAGIAREKAGIAKRGVPFVIGEADPTLAAVLRAEALQRGAEAVVVGAEERYDGPLGLKGSHQRRNAAVAAALLGHVPAPYRPPPEAVQRGFAGARLPGRFDRRGRWIFDVAHNPGGVMVLLATLAEERPSRPLHALVGILQDKAWEEMLRALRPAVDRLVVTTPPTAPEARRWALAEVARRLGEAVEAEADFGLALERVAENAASILVTGSFHTVGDAMARLPGFAPLG